MNCVCNKPALIQQTDHVLKQWLIKERGESFPFGFQISLDFILRFFSLFVQQ
jgi:hypothetical protein